MAPAVEGSNSSRPPVRQPSFLGYPDLGVECTYHSRSKSSAPSVGSGSEIGEARHVRGALPAGHDLDALADWIGCEQVAEPGRVRVVEDRQGLE